MANVDVKKTRDTESRDQAGGKTTGMGGDLQRRAAEGRGALARPRFGWGFSPFDVWGASPFELMRRMSADLGFPGGGEDWSPAIETFERDGRYVVRAELPGMKPEDVKVELSDEGLCIEGERRHESREEREGFFRSERSYGRFCRRIPLPPESLKAEDARAEFKDGVLEVSLPMLESSSRRRQVPIQTGGATSGTTSTPRQDTTKR